MNAITKPTAISSAALGAEVVRAPRADRARTPPPSSASRERTRTRPRPARSTPHRHRRRRSSPPDRDTPGISASAWNDADRRRARPIGSLVDASSTSARGRSRSTISMTMPPTMNATAMTDEAVVEHALHEARRAARRRRAAGTDASDDHQREAPRVRAATAARRRTATIFARYSHITARIEPSWIITVNTPPGSS